MKRQVRARKRRDYDKCHGAQCKNCGSQDIFWIPLFPSMKVKTNIKTRWCWTCGNAKLKGFLNVFNGYELKPKFIK